MIVFSASFFTLSNSLVSSPFSVSKPIASSTNSATSARSVALVISAVNTAFSSDNKLFKPLTIASAFVFWICSFSSFVSPLTRLSPLIIFLDGLLTVLSGNVSVAVPSSEISTIVPVGKLLATLMASSTFSFSSCVNSSKLLATIFSGIFTPVFPGTDDNFWKSRLANNHSLCTFFRSSSLTLLIFIRIFSSDSDSFVHRVLNSP